jgi:hypothetical protein
MGLACLGMAPAAAEQPALHFASPEHEFLGARVLLRLPDGGRAAGDHVVLLRTRSSDGTELALSYAELLALAGDFYGVPYARVGDGQPFDSAWSARSEAATVAFRRDLLSLAYQGYVDDLPRLRELQRGLMQRFVEARGQGRALDYRTEDDCAFMRATGAEACIESAADLIHLRNYLGRYFDLASRSQDHFGDNAQTTFLVGQRLALQQALHARDQQDLWRAYRTAAYAGHFGSDAFASGHVRTDKQAIDEYCAGGFAEAPLRGHTAQILSGVLVKTMHDRENRDGIVLSARDGRRWVAHGDNELSLPGGEAEMRPIVQTLQLAADQVFDAYQRRGRVDEARYVEDSLAALRRSLPDIAATRDGASGNPPPLFEPRGGTVLWNDPEGASAPLDCEAALWRYAGGLAQSLAQDGRPGAGTHEAAARSIDVTVVVAGSREPPGSARAGGLSCDWARIDHGDFPASEGHFTHAVTAHLESNGAATGAEGDLYCLLLRPDARELACQFTVHYDNPFWGADRQFLRQRAGACEIELDDAGRGRHWRPRLRVRPSGDEPRGRESMPAAHS